MGSSHTWESLARELTTLQGAVLKHAFHCVSKSLAVGRGELAILANAPDDEVWLAVRELEAAGLLQTDKQGSLVGALGLSLAPSQHQLILSGRTLYGWCAEDVVGIPAALGWNAKVSSLCGECRLPITVYLQAGEICHICRPAGVRLWLNDVVKQMPVCTGTCPQIQFFCSREHAEEWLSEHSNATGKLIDLEEAAQIGRKVWGWLAGLSGAEAHAGQILRGPTDPSGL